MKPTSRRLMDIIDDIFYDTVGVFMLDDFEFVVDQAFMCPIHDAPQFELTELARTQMPHIVEAIVLGGKPTNHYQVTIQPIGLSKEER